VQNGIRECLLSFSAEFFVLSLLSKNIKIKIYRTIILPDVFNGCETWSLTLREVCRLRVFEWILHRTGVEAFVKLVKYTGNIRYVNFVVCFVIMSWHALILQMEKVAMDYEG
jgi:hypothetical protein